MTHEEEIKRWAKCQDGTPVWQRSSNGTWSWSTLPQWLANCTYLVADKYLEVRRFYVMNGFIWITYPSNGSVVKDTKPDFSYPVEAYTMTDPRPKFKTGDWVLVEAVDQGGKRMFLASVSVDMADHVDALLKTKDINENT